MSQVPKLVPLEKSAEEIRQTILTNIVKMLIYREWIDKQNEQNEINNLINHQSDNLTYGVKLISGDIYSIKFTGQKVTTVNNTYGLKDFLHANKDKSNLIIVKDINKKARESINRHHPKTEVFTEDELMLDLSSHVLFHPHSKLIDRNDEEKTKEFLEAYSLSSKRKLPKIAEDDISARYLNLKRGDICKILRPSETSGYVPFYRLVV
jgi:DNA-directed RNA polymerase subunit H (RpoH/RPB5)